MSDSPLFDGQGIEFDHLQRLQQQRKTSEIRRLLEQEARQRRGVCPCPHCGGGIPQVGASVCMHCRRELYWQAGFCAATIEKARELAKNAAKALAAEETRKRQYEQEVAANRAYSASPEGIQKKAERVAKQRKEKAQEMRGCLMALVGVTLVASGCVCAFNAHVSLLFVGCLICVGVFFIILAVSPLGRLKG